MALAHGLLPPAGAASPDQENSHDRVSINAANLRPAISIQTVVADFDCGVGGVDVPARVCPDARDGFACRLRPAGHAKHGHTVGTYADPLQQRGKVCAA